MTPKFADALRKLVDTIITEHCVPDPECFVGEQAMIAFTGIILEEISAHQDPSHPHLQEWASALLRAYADEFKSAREYTEERAA